MAVKRIIPKRLEKTAVASETEALSNVFIENIIDKRIAVTTENPLNNPRDVKQGNIWRNPATNPNDWNMLINGSWENMLCTTSEHGLMNNLDKLMLDNANEVSVADTLVLRDSASEISAHAFNTVSSKRFKTGITKIENATEMIKLLEGVNFTWEKDGKQDIGLIAEDVLEIIPEIVKVENGVVEGLAYDRIVAVLIEGFKEQENKIDRILKHLGLDNE